MKFLITGVAGFVGYYTAKLLLESGHSVVGLDNLNDYYTPELKRMRLANLDAVAKNCDATAWTFFEGNLEDRELVDNIFAKFSFDRVIHLAAQAGVRYSLENPHAYISSNIVGFLNILEACKNYSIAHLVYASSSSVYGMNQTFPFNESDAVDHPVSLYAATKRSNELMAHTYSHLYGLPTTGLRFFTVYGPMGRPDMAYFSFTKAILNDKAITIYNNGDLMRDFTYIDDIVKAVVLIADSVPLADKTSEQATTPNKSSAPFKIYNIGNSSPEKLMDFIHQLEKSLGKEAKKNFLPMQAGDVYMTGANTSKLEKQFGWKPSTSIAEGLETFCAWALGDGSQFFK